MTQTSSVTRYVDVLFAALMLMSCRAQVLITSAPTPSGAGTAVCRYWHEGDRDWVTMGRGANEPGDADMSNWGYQRQTCGHRAFSEPGPGLVAVHRWWHPGDRDWVTVPEGQISDETMQGWGYERKTLDFYAHATQAPGTVAVYRWWHPGDRDWVTVAEGEISPSDLQAWGYVNRTGPLYYASVTPR